MQAINQLMKRVTYLLYFFIIVSVSAINAQNSSVISKSNKTVASIDSLSSNSVYKPVLSSSNTKIMNWAITTDPFYKLYLSSLTTYYSLFVPTDEYLDNYIDPIAYGQDKQGVLKFWYNSNTATVNATVYKYDKQIGIVGDSVGVITNQTFLSTRLVDLLNSHIVVGDVQSGKSFYMTRGNVPLKIEGSGIFMTVKGGADIENATTATATPPHVMNVYSQTNGKTYFLNKPISPTLKSVYKVLSETPEFSSFYSLLVGFDNILITGSPIFGNIYGIDYNVKFFKTYNYTVYVPTNAAIQQAISNGIIIPWDSQGSIVGIYNMTDKTTRDAAISKLERFLRYHFQDNSVFVDNLSVDKVYQSATIKNVDGATGFGTSKNKFYKIRVSGNGSDLTLTTETGKTAHVLTENGLYNILTRDYVFSNRPTSFKNIDGTGTGTDFSTSSISTSSTAVIHQIDNVLTFE